MEDQQDPEDKNLIFILIPLKTDQLHCTHPAGPVPAQPAPHPLSSGQVRVLLPGPRPWKCPVAGWEHGRPVPRVTGQGTLPRPQRTGQRTGFFLFISPLPFSQA